MRMNVFALLDLCQNRRRIAKRLDDARNNEARTMFGALLVIYNLIIIRVPFVIMNALRAHSNVLLSRNSLSLDDVRES